DLVIGELAFLAVDQGDGVAAMAAPRLGQGMENRTVRNLRIERDALRWSKVGHGLSDSARTASYPIFGLIEMSGGVKMPNPALEAAHQLLAARRCRRLEQAGDLLPKRLGVGPELLSLGLEGAAQGLDHLALDPLGPDQGHRDGGQADGADHRIGGAGGAAGGQPEKIANQAGRIGVAADLLDGTHGTATGT